MREVVDFRKSGHNLEWPNSAVTYTWSHVMHLQFLSMNYIAQRLKRSFILETAITMAYSPASSAIEGSNASGEMDLMHLACDYVKTEVGQTVTEEGMDHCASCTMVVTEESRRVNTDPEFENLNWEALVKATESYQDSSGECCSCSTNVCHNCKLRAALFSKVIRVARNEGWKILKGRAFPLLSEYGRRVWTAVQLLFSLVIFTISIYTFVTGKKRRLDIANVLFAVCSTVFAVTDFLAKWGNTSHESNAWKLWRKVCKLFTNAYADIFCMVMSEFFIYALLICSVLKIVCQQAKREGETTSDSIEMILFSLKTLWMVISISLFQMVIGYAFRHIHLKRKIIGSKASKSGRDSLIRFYFHVVGQMFIQALMIAVIWGRIHQENPVMEEDIHVSALLRYMIVAGFALPIIGLVPFAIFNYGELQKFPVGVTLDTLSLRLNKREFTDIHKSRLSEAELRKVEQILSQYFIEMENNAMYKYMLLLSETSIISVIITAATKRSLFCMHAVDTIRFNIMMILSFGYFLTLVTFVICSTNLVDSPGWFLFFGIMIVFVTVHVTIANNIALQFYWILFLSGLIIIAVLVVLVLLPLCLSLLFSFTNTIVVLVALVSLLIFVLCYIYF